MHHVCVCARAHVYARICACVCAQTKNLPLHVALIIPLYLVSRGSLGSLCLETKPTPPGLPSVTCARICALVRRGGASLFRASAKDTVEKYHNKCVLEGEAAVVLFRWLIYGRRGLHIKTVCETSSVDTN